MIIFLAIQIPSYIWYCATYIPFARDCIKACLRGCLKKIKKSNWFIKCLNTIQYHFDVNCICLVEMVFLFFYDTSYYFLIWYSLIEMVFLFFYYTSSLFFNLIFKWSGLFIHLKFHSYLNKQMINQSSPLSDIEDNSGKIVESTSCKIDKLMNSFNTFIVQNY